MTLWRHRGTKQWLIIDLMRPDAGLDDVIDYTDDVNKATVAQHMPVEIQRICEPVQAKSIRVECLPGEIPFDRGFDEED